MTSSFLNPIPHMDGSTAMRRLNSSASIIRYRGHNNAAWRQPHSGVTAAAVALQQPALTHIVNPGRTTVILRRQPICAELLSSHFAGLVDAATRARHVGRGAGAYHPARP